MSMFLEYFPSARKRRAFAAKVEKDLGLKCSISEYVAIKLEVSDEKVARAKALAEQFGAAWSTIQSTAYIENLSCDRQRRVFADAIENMLNLECDLHEYVTVDRPASPEEERRIIKLAEEVFGGTFTGT